MSESKMVVEASARGEVAFELVDLLLEELIGKVDGFTKERKQELFTLALDRARKWHEETKGREE